MYSQVDTAWIRRYNGLGDTLDYAYAIALDRQGNVYVTGHSWGLGTMNDYTTIKYNSNGDTLWVRRYNGTGNLDDEARYLTVDSQCNVYVTGYSFDSGTGADYLTIKYNSAGVEQWVQRYNGPENLNDYANSLIVDGQGNVYVTGLCYIVSGIDCDYVTIKYNSAGVEQWVQRYNGLGNSYDAAYAIATDSSGNIYVTGGSFGLGTHYDCATIKYNSNGDTLWIRRYNGPGNNDDEAYYLTVDSQCNVYVTGYSCSSGLIPNFVTIKYNSAGTQQWVARYNGPGTHGDYASSIAVDVQGNVYVTGSSDSNSNPETTNMDYATIKYNSSGIQEWVQRYNGPGNSHDYANSLAIDGQGNIYVTGSSFGSGTHYDYMTIKYNSAGTQQWVARYNGSGNLGDNASSIIVDEQDNVYITGGSSGSSSYEDFATIKYVQTGAIEETREVRSNGHLSLEILPNPASNYFTIRLPSFNNHIKIFDVSGKIIKEVRNMTQEMRVSLDGIENGVYFIKIDNSNEVTKIIITK